MKVTTVYYSCCTFIMISIRLRRADQFHLCRLCTGEEEEARKKRRRSNQTAVQHSSVQFSLGSMQSGPGPTVGSFVTGLSGTLAGLPISLGFDEDALTRFVGRVIHGLQGDCASLCLHTRDTGWITSSRGRSERQTETVAMAIEQQGTPRTQALIGLPRCSWA